VCLSVLLWTRFYIGDDISSVGKKSGLKVSGSFDKFTTICHRICPNHRKSETPRPCQRSGMKTCGIGTSLYAAPEQLHSHEYGEEVDIFSLGLLLVELFSISKTKKHRYKKLERARGGDLPPSMLTEYPQEAMLAMQLLHENPLQRPKASQMLSHQLFQGFQRHRESRQPTSRPTHVLRGASTPIMRTPFRTLQGSVTGSPQFASESVLDSINEKQDFFSAKTPTPVQRRHMRTLEILRDSDTPRHVYSSSRDSDTPMPFFVLPSSLSDETSSTASTAGQSPSSSSRSSPSLSSSSASYSPSLCHCLPDREKLEANLSSHKQIIEQLSTQIIQQQEQIKQKDAMISKLTKALEKSNSTSTSTTVGTTKVGTPR
jgi:serine/threonine protein kinase